MLRLSRVGWGIGRWGAGWVGLGEGLMVSCHVPRVPGLGLEEGALGPLGAGVVRYVQGLY